MNFISRWNTAVQLAAIMTAMVVFSSAAVGWMTYQRLNVDLVQSELDRLHLQAQSVATNFETAITSLGADAKFLAETPPPAGYVRAGRSGGIDRADGTSTQAVWISQLERIFRQFLEANPHYLQIRFLAREPNGQELLRLDRRNGIVVRIADEELQQKGSRYYFQEAMQRDRIYGVFISRLDLNQENGEITMPQQPVVRAVANVYSDDDELPFGAIVINMDIDSVVGRIRQQIHPGLELFAVSESGSFFIHPDASLRFDSEMGHGFSVNDQWQEIAFGGPTPLPASFLWKTADGSMRAVGVASLAGDVWENESGSAFFLSGNMDAIAPHLKSVREQVWQTSILLIAIAIIVAVLLSGLFTRRLRVLVANAQAVAAGDYDVSLSDTGRDDVGRLAQAMASMSDSVREKVGELEETQLQLRQKSEFLESVLENIPAMIFIKDATELRFLRFNHAAEQITGLSADEVIGKNDFDFFPTSEAKAYVEADRETLRGRSVVIIGDETITHKDGTKRILNTRKVAIRDQDGKPVSLLGIAQDVTEVRRAAADLEFNEKRLRSIVETAAEGIITIDSDGEVLTFNRAASEMFGYAPAEVVDHDVKMLMPEHIRSKHGDSLRHYVVTGESSGIIGNAVEVTAMRRDGTTFPMRLSVAEAAVDERRIFTGVVRDLTTEKEYERRILESRRLAEEANSAKSNFLATMSHELRTPLNAIIGYSEMLVEDAEQGEEMPDLAEDLGRIRGAGRNLLSLINDVLDLSKIEAGGVELDVTKFSLRQLITDVVNTARPLVEKRGNSFVVSIDDDAIDQVRSDSTRVRQILLNLLSNAAKFTSNGTVWLEVRTAEDAVNGARDMVYDVRDTGIGITSDKLERIFEPFLQADASTTREYGGTGLGLAISKSNCALLGGEISVESKLGTGTCFTVRLPAALELSDGHAEESPGALENTSERLDRSNLVLVVDDSDAGRALMANQLRRLGYEIAEASSGIEGLALARKLRPGAIILDVMMPELDGWSVLRLLKAEPDLADIPVILCTIIDARGTGMALGASEYLLKPVSRRQLKTTLSKYCMNPPCNLLVVEDDLPTRDIFCRTARNQGWNVAEAATGHEALSQIEKLVPDVILLDLMMPELDGFEVVEALQRKEAWQNIPVVVLTAKDLSKADVERLNGFVAEIVAKSNENVRDILSYVGRKLRQLVDRRA